jgi:hypothetical protein
MQVVSRKRPDRKLYDNDTDSGMYRRAFMKLCVCEQHCVKSLMYFRGIDWKHAQIDPKAIK